MIFYIPSQEVMINSDHIIRAKYIPTHVYRDTEDEGPDAPERTFHSLLTLVLAEQVMDKEYGTASISKNMFISNLEADYLWDALKRQAYALSPIPTSPQDLTGSNPPA